MKKSLQIAIDEAKQMSIQHPETTYIVMDKKGKRSVVHSYFSDWLIRERMLEGYYTVVKYKDGKEV